MEEVVYKSIPDYAIKIRKRVFEEEQGFQNEFDEKDNISAHIVLFDKGKVPIATCRVFWDAEKDSYILGRLAVVKEYRGKNIGSVVVGEAEQYVSEKGGKCIALHAQCRASAFYAKLGYTEFGSIEDDEGCPHIWMRKYI